MKSLSFWMYLLVSPSILICQTDLHVHFKGHTIFGLFQAAQYQYYSIVFPDMSLGTEFYFAQGETERLQAKIGILASWHSGLSFPNNCRRSTSFCYGSYVHVPINIGYALVRKARFQSSIFLGSQISTFMGTHNWPGDKTTSTLDGIASWEQVYPLGKGIDLFSALHTEHKIVNLGRTRYPKYERRLGIIIGIRRFI